MVGIQVENGTGWDNHGGGEKWLGLAHSLKGETIWWIRWTQGMKEKRSKD